MNRDDAPIDRLEHYRVRRSVRSAPQMAQMHPDGSGGLTPVAIWGHLGNLWPSGPAPAGVNML